MKLQKPNVCTSSFIQIANKQWTNNGITIARNMHLFAIPRASYIYIFFFVCNNSDGAETMAWSYSSFSYLDSCSMIEVRKYSNLLGPFVDDRGNSINIFRKDHVCHLKDPGYVPLDYGYENRLILLCLSTFSWLLNLYPIWSFRVPFWVDIKAC